MPSTKYTGSWLTGVKDVMACGRSLLTRLSAYTDKRIFNIEAQASSKPVAAITDDCPQSEPVIVRRRDRPK